MKTYTSENVRNIAFMGHSGSGKSTLAEAMLFSHKHIDRLGKTEDGSLTSDFDPEEKTRRMSINSSVLPIETKSIKINIIDCPGNRDFIGETLAATRVVEAGLIFLDATSGVEVGTEIAMERAEELGLPVAAFVTKLDKENTDFAKICDQITDVLGRKAVPFTLPIGQHDNITGVVDLTRKKAVMEENGKVTLGDIPAEMQGDVETFNEVIVEAAAEGEDSLMEKFFEEGELTDEEVSHGLQKAFMAGSFIPVFCGIPTKGIGVEPILHFIEASCPSPLEGRGLQVKDSEDYQKADPENGFSAFVFKTLSDDFAGRLNFFKVMTGKLTTSTPLYNITRDHSEKISHLMAPRGKKQEEIDELVAGDIGVVSKLSHTQTNDTLAEPKTSKQYAATEYPQRTTFIAIHAADSKDEDKIGVGVHSIIEQDPTLHIERDPEVHQTILSGMGEQHLDVAISRLKTKTKVDVVLEPPKVRYRETITKQAEGSYRHKKQSGGRGQFAEVHIRLSPLQEEEYSFTWSVFGGAVPTNFQSAIDRGAQMAMEKGILAGYRVVNIGVDCFDGKHHPVDSSDMAFQLASSQAFKQVALKANPIILEPICDVTTTVPEGNMGDVMGDVSQRRGRIQGTEPKGKKVVVIAQVPEGEMQTYSQQLRSMTGGRGVFERRFSHYEPVPGDVQQKIIDEAAKHKEEEEV